MILGAGKSGKAADEVAFKRFQLVVAR